MTRLWTAGWPVLLLLIAATPTVKPELSDRMIAVRIALDDVERTAAEVQDPRLRRRLTARIARVNALLTETSPGLSDTDPDFQAALDALEAERFDNERLERIRSIASERQFSCEQAALLAATCTFDSARAEALLLLYPALSDPQQLESALDVLEFGTTRARVRQLLGG